MGILRTLSLGDSISVALRKLFWGGEVSLFTVLWPPHAKSWLIGKDFDAGRDWGQEKKGMTEDEMAGWHHWLDECESEWTPGAGDGQGGLACCDSWDCKELDMTERLNWTELNKGSRQYEHQRSGFKLRNLAFYVREDASSGLKEFTSICTSVACQAPLSIGILQARILEWVAISFSRGSSWPRDWIYVSYDSCLSR